MEILKTKTISGEIIGKATYTLLKYGTKFAFGLECDLKNILVTSVIVPESKADKIFDILVKNICFPAHIEEVISDFVWCFENSSLTSCLYD